MRDVQYPNPMEELVGGDDPDHVSMTASKAETMKKILQSVKECIVKSTFSALLPVFWERTRRSSIVELRLEFQWKQLLHSLFF